MNHRTKQKWVKAGLQENEEIKETGKGDNKEERCPKTERYSIASKFEREKEREKEKERKESSK